MLRSRPSVDRGVPQVLSPLSAWACRSLVLAYCITSAVHVILRVRNLTMHCPAKSGLIGVVNNYAHCWRFFTSQLWRHNCVIISESASATVAITNWWTRGSSIIPLRITWLTTMFTDLQVGVLHMSIVNDLSHLPALFKHVSLPLLKENP